MLRDCVEAALALVALPAGAKDLDVVADFDESCPGMVRGDRTRLRQVLVNLLGNAVKFTERREILVNVSARQLADRADGRLLVSVEVRDTGIGIPEDGMHRLFQSFSQVDSSTTRVYGGTGLGLAISRRLAQAMGELLTQLLLSFVERARGSFDRLSSAIQQEDSSQVEFLAHGLKGSRSTSVRMCWDSSARPWRHRLGPGAWRPPSLSRNKLGKSLLR